MFRKLLLIILLISPFCIIGQENNTITKKANKNIITKIITYFDDSNKEKEYKKFDFSVIGVLIMQVILN